MFENQIKAGMTLLDEKVPGWEKKIDFEELDLSETSFCIVGQVFPDRSYYDVMEDLFGIDIENDDHLFKKSDSCGFATSDFRKYPELTEEWKQFIQDRRTKQESTTTS